MSLTLFQGNKEQYEKYIGAKVEINGPRIEVRAVPDYSGFRFVGKTNSLPSTLINKGVEAIILTTPRNKNVAEFLEGEPPYEIEKYISALRPINPNYFTFVCGFPVKRVN